MRRFIKREIVNILHTLEQAANKTQTLLGSGRQDVLQVLLTDCQEAAISIGNQIEESEGEGTEAVLELQEYCELLYLTLMGDIKAAAGLRKSIVKVCNLVEKFPETLEIVFLPYKVSMWDSMESIWMAAMADDTCNVHVIPIPYFDKNPDGSLAQMHYEGELYPEYVPVERYDGYDFKVQKPDVVYIHNPYDEYNFVTSVHPFFYSSNLKQYTDKLVYVPYFVSTDYIKEDYCVQAGIVYADSVVVQSDVIRDTYVKNCKKVLGKDFPGKKIIACGSPKYDKVIRMMKDGIEIPENWKDKIKDKKVVLYNTHLNTLLKYETVAINKIEAVFAYFASQDEAVLLWRPHPLSKETLKSMRTELYERYCELEQKFLTEDIGIYDDSEDMYPAIYVADAYYGDSSSVITVFGVTGRPICLQNVTIPDCKMKGQRFESVCADGKVLYFANMDTNTLGAFCPQTGEVLKLGQFPQADGRQKRITQNIGMWSGKLWMLPFNGNCVYAYDLNTGEWECYPLPKEWPTECTKNIIFAGKQIGRYYYGFCAGRYGVMRLDMENGEIAYCRNRLEEYKQGLLPSVNSAICRQDCCVVNEKIYVACMTGNMVLEYDTNTMDITVHTVGDKACGYATLCYDGENFWLTETGGRLIKWNHITGQTQEIPLELSTFSEPLQCGYASSLYAGGYVWLFAHSAKENLRINVQTGEAAIVYSFADGTTTFPAKVTKSWCTDTDVYFVDAVKHVLVQMDCNTLRIREYEIPYLQEDTNRMWESEKLSSYKDYVHREGTEPGKSTQGLVRYILGSEKVRSEGQTKCFLEFTKYPEGNAGEMIHRKIKEKDW